MTDLSSYEPLREAKKVYSFCEISAIKAAASKKTEENPKNNIDHKRRWQPGLSWAYFRSLKVTQTEGFSEIVTRENK